MPLCVKYKTFLREPCSTDLWLPRVRVDYNAPSKTDRKCPRVQSAEHDERKATRPPTHCNSPTRTSETCPLARSSPTWNARAITAPCSTWSTVNRQPATGSQWMTGAVGNGEWLGPSLRDVLTLAGIRDSAHNRPRCRRKHPTRHRVLQRKGLPVQPTSPPSHPRRMTSPPLFLDNPYPQVTIALNGRYLRSKRRK